MRTNAASLSAALVVAFVTAPAPLVFGHPTDDGTNAIMPPPPTYKGNDVAVSERLGVHVPLDAQFRTSDGKSVKLGDVLAGEIPTILTFNYSDCPMLCSLQLNGLTTALPLTEKGTPLLRAGAQFRIVTIDLEPSEPLDKLAKMRERYLQRFPADTRDTIAAGWTFLAAGTPGDGAAIRRVAEAVGFQYTYIPERAEWAHPAALIFLSSAGAVTRYVYGIDFEPAVMRESIMKAGQAEAATAVGFMNRCYHYDPDANSHAHAGVVALRIGAGAFVVLMISALGMVHLVKKHRVAARGTP